VESIKKTVGHRCRELRKRAGFVSAESAAEALAVSPTTVYELERGDNWISPEMLTKMASAYRADPATFFTNGPVIVEPTPEEALRVLSKAIRQPPKGTPAIPEDLVERLEGADPDDWDEIRAIFRDKDMVEASREEARKKGIGKKIG
jgi:transcriptional regulator with XRE-family HTH domain